MPMTIERIWMRGTVTIIARKGAAFAPGLCKLRSRKGDGDFSKPGQNAVLSRLYAHDALLSIGIHPHTSNKVPEELAEEEAPKACPNAICRWGESDRVSEMRSHASHHMSQSYLQTLAKIETKRAHSCQMKAPMFRVVGLEVVERVGKVSRVTGGKAKEGKSSSSRERRVARKGKMTVDVVL